jgi:hypothetical protein
MRYEVHTFTRACDRGCRDRLEFHWCLWKSYKSKRVAEKRVDHLRRFGSQAKIKEVRPC